MWPQNAGNPYSRPLPQESADVYAERYLPDQLFTDAHLDAVSFDRSLRQFVVNPDPSASATTPWKPHRSPTPTHASNAVGRVTRDHFRPNTPQSTPSFTITQHPSFDPNFAVQVQLTPEMIQHARDFRNAVEAFKKSSKNAVTLDLDRPGTWADLISDVELAKERYQLAQNGSTTSKAGAWIRKGFRNLAKLSGPVQAWLGMVPDGMFGEAKIITGGLRVIFQAASGLENMRDETYDTIEQIPQTLANASRLAQLYTSASDLQESVSQLYVAVVESLTTIVSWYQQSRLRKVTGAVLKGPDYGARMKKCLEQLRKLDQIVHKQGTIESHDKLDNVDKNLLNFIRCYGMNSAYKMLHDQMMGESIRADLQKVSLQLERQEHRRNREDQERQQRRQRRLSNSLNAIQYDPRALLVDHQTVLQAGLSFDHTKQAYAASMLMSDQVQSWLRPGPHSPLVVNAHLTSSRGVSSVSLFSSMLVRHLEESEPSVILSWFCSAHTEDDDCINMLLSLIGQVLSSPLFNPECLDEGYDDFMQSLRPQSQAVESLANTLHVLMRRQLEFTSLIVVLDSVSIYESNTFSEMMSFALGAILDLCVEQADSNNVCKLILTSPMTLTLFDEMIEGYGGCKVLDLYPLRFNPDSSLLDMVNSLLHQVEE